MIKLHIMIATATSQDILTGKSDHDAFGCTTFPIDSTAERNRKCERATPPRYGFFSSRFTFTSDTTQLASMVPRARAPGLVAQDSFWLRAAMGPVHS